MNVEEVLCTTTSIVYLLVCMIDHKPFNGINSGCFSMKLFINDQCTKQLNVCLHLNSVKIFLCLCVRGCPCILINAF